MKLAIPALLAATFLLASCGEVRFTEPMPQHTSELVTIPAECQGTFLTEDGDTLRATSTGVFTGDLEFHLVKGNDQFTIRTGDAWLFANLKAEDGTYYVLPFRSVGDRDVEIAFFEYDGDNYRTVEDVTPIIEEKEGMFEVPLIAPTVEEFNALMSSGHLDVHRLKRIAP